MLCRNWFMGKMGEMGEVVGKVSGFFMYWPRIQKKVYEGDV